MEIMTSTRALELVALSSTELDRFFWICVHLIALFGEATGLGYAGANIAIFVVAQPVLIVLLALAWLRASLRARLYRRQVQRRDQG